METTFKKLVVTKSADLKKIFAEHGEGLNDNALRLYDPIDGTEFTTEVTLKEGKNGGVYLAMTHPITKTSETVGMGKYYDVLRSDKSPMEIGKPYLAEMVFRQIVPGLTLEMAKAVYASNPAAIANFTVALSKPKFKRIDVEYISIPV